MWMKWKNLFAKNKFSLRTIAQLWAEILFNISLSSSFENELNRMNKRTIKRRTPRKTNDSAFFSGRKTYKKIIFGTIMS